MLGHTNKIEPATEQRLRDLVARFRYDAFGFVMTMFPWGVKNTTLAKKSGPEPWQADLLHALSVHTLDNQYLKIVGFDYKVMRSAVASGHGVGKSALVAWIILWLMSTRMDTRGVVTANTATQLQTKTWPELGKWYNMMLNKHWFTWTAASLYYRDYPEDKQKNYKVDALTVSPENSEAWAGLHNEHGTVFVIFDEASGIDRELWRVAEGAFTDGEPFFLVFGNPTKPDGPFAECFTEDAAGRWRKENVDSRSVSHTNKAHLADLIRVNGIDSDFVRIRVLGQFPEKAYDGFLSAQCVTTAMQRELFFDDGVALVMAIDVARYGDDETVFGFRQGNDARSIPWVTRRGLDGVSIAHIAVDLINKYKPDAVVIESVGPGVTVIDVLRSWGYKVLEIHPGAPSSQPKQWLNIKAELWAKGKDWIDNRGCLSEHDGQLFKQLTTIRYVLQGAAETVLKMEPKADLKARGEESPDRADTLMLTFAYNIARRDKSRNTRPSGVGSTNRAKTEYDEFAL